MTPQPGALADVLRRGRYLLFDFDGPICSIFASLSAPAIADHLRQLIAGRGIELSAEAAASGDPFDVLRFAASISREMARPLAMSCGGWSYGPST